MNHLETKIRALIFVFGVAVGMTVVICLHTQNYHHVYRRVSPVALTLSPTCGNLAPLQGEQHEYQESQNDIIATPVDENDASLEENPSQDLEQVKVEEIISDEPWEFLSGRKVYDGLMANPGYILQEHLSKDKEISMVRAELADAASREFKKNMKVTAISDAYLRRDPLQGTKYMFDVELMDMESDEERPFNARIELSRVFEHKLNTSVITYKELETVNFIVPVMNVKERFRAFMQTYEKQFLRRNEKVRLILVVYGRASFNIVNRTVTKFHSLHPSANITVISKPASEYSKSKALDTGIAQLKDSDLAFFCDVDILVRRAFAQRCRRNAIQGKRVYFPEVFKMYNLDYVYWKEKKPLYPYLATRAHGHWGSYGYGMVCVYKSDYLKVGGLNTSIVGWGGEDVDFYKQVSKKMDLMQAPDTALWHRWHPKECSPQLSKSQYDSCMKSKYECLADRRELASLIYERGIKP